MNLASARAVVRATRSANGSIRDIAAIGPAATAAIAIASAMIAPRTRLTSRAIAAEPNARPVMNTDAIAPNA
jgi:hypothetical protein